MVLVTRPSSQAGRLSRRLEDVGATVLEIPTIRLLPPDDRRPLLQAARSVESYDWVLFSSANGVQAFVGVLEEVGSGAEALRGVCTAVIGPATASALRGTGIEPDVMPASYRAEGLAEAVIEQLGDPRATEQRILLPRASGARRILPLTLRLHGAKVDEVIAYRAVSADEERARLRAALRSGVDWITFTSSSTVRSFVELSGGELRGARLAAIGPITARTARDAGLEVAAIAEMFTSEGLVEALVRTERRDETDGAPE